jgi:hypothetical protein
MHESTRTFADSPAKRDRVPLIIGLSGPSGSGKTYSALELATGIQSVVGGDIYGVDTESKRMLHYADYFKFRHVPFTPPFGPLDYMAAFQHCIAKGAKIIIADSLSHEHDGDGGVLDQIDEFLTKKAGDNWDKRNQYLFLANAKPKAERKKLNQFIVQNGDVIWILCYRAQDKTKPLKKGQQTADGEKIVHLGWQPITTSPLVFDMTARFLLGPACEGRPMTNPQEEAEKLMIKNPRQFAGWVKPDQQINAELGAKMARWAVGDSAAAPDDILAKLVKLNVSEARALALVGRATAAELTADDIAILATKGRNIVNKRQTADEAFPQVEPGTAG